MLQRKEKVHSLLLIECFKSGRNLKKRLFCDNEVSEILDLEKDQRLVRIEKG